ncbi:MAG TPA: DUF2855 family protein, partial [Dongiaceae bacterium]|nr:DUF2855 family protein [Dongiaceae bacterium]
MASSLAQELLINRKVIEQAEIATSDEGSRPLQEGEIRFSIDRFGLSSNNITYVAMGDMMQYWDIFPAKEGWGRIPVWGFADVIESRCAQLSTGERFYGLFPAASHVILKVGAVSEKSFLEASANRNSLAAIYNTYVRQSSDQYFLDESADAQVAFRPLFMTSYLIDAFLATHDYFGAHTLVFGSASSKTAFGTATLLAANHAQRRLYRVVGLTSRNNLEFVRSLGCYDEVVDYTEVTALNNNEKAVYIDMSGNLRVRRSVHTHFGDNLTYSCWVGVTHWTKLGFGIPLPGPEPVLFFAPTELQRHIKEQGSDNFQRRFRAGWDTMLLTAQKTIELRSVSGAAAILDAYHQILSGACGPAVAHV